MRLGQNWLRSRRRDLSRETGPVDDDRQPAAEDDPLGHLISDEDDRRLWRAVQALPSGERTAVILYYRQDLSVAEIAGAVGVTSGTIKTFRLPRTAPSSQRPWRAPGRDGPKGIEMTSRLESRLSRLPDPAPPASLSAGVMARVARAADSPDVTSSRIGGLGQVLPAVPLEAPVLLLLTAGLLLYFTGLFAPLRGR